MPSERRIGPLLLVPIVAYLSVTTLFPLGYLVYLSLVDWNLTEKTITYVGLQNFANILSPNSISAISSFYPSLAFTLAFAGSATSIEFLLGLGIALLLNRDNILAKIATALLIIPLMMTPVLLDMIWKYLLNPLLGPLTYLLSIVGIASVDYLGSVPSVYFSLLIVDMWQWTPLIALILLAGLLSLPKSQYEAAILDGADELTVFRRLTLPMLARFVTVAVLFRLIDSLKTFNKIYILTSGGPGGATETVSYNIFYHSFGFTLDVGYSAAMSITFFAIVMAIVVFLVLRFQSAILGERGSV
jgi:multiple sugar transport system permease protein